VGPRFDDRLVDDALRRVGAPPLCGRYRILRLLGIGGMGAVYAGRHRNGHPVAIKILHERWGATPELEKQFRREAQLANTVNHPAIVPVTDDDVSEDGCVFLVMPLLQGESVRARWERSSRRLPVEEVLSIAHAVLGALAAAHAAKIVHRDIKPDNLFLTPDGVRILDFGIARFFEASDPALATKSGRAVGTPAFMAPEQALGRSLEIDGRTDLWALGATMFALLSGRLVHEAGNSSEILILAGTRSAPPLVGHAPDVPEAICAVVDRALAFKRADRWETAEEMDRALSAAVKSALGKSTSALVAPVVDSGSAVLDPPTATERLLVEAESPHAPPTPPAPGAPPRAATTRTLPRAQALRRLHPGARSAVLTVLVVAAVALIAVVSLSVSRRTKVPSGESAAAAHAPTRAEKTELPREASEACRAGWQAWEDGSNDLARHHFERATAIAPSCASAHLGYVAASLWPDDALRRHFQDASRNRTELDSRDAAFLDAFEPLARHPARFRAAADRLRTALESYPGDARLTVARAMVLIKLGEEDQAAKELQGLLASNPRLGSARLQLGVSQALGGHVAAARETYRECMDSSPSATTCMANLGRLDAFEGECEDLKLVAHRELSVNPSSVDGYEDLARALFATGAPSEAVAEALEHQWKGVESPTKRATIQPELRARHAILNGDLDAALRLAREAERSVVDQLDEASHLDPMLLMFDIEFELGFDRDADGTLSSFLLGEHLWLPDSYFDYSILASALRYRLGTIERPAFVDLRNEWLARQRDHEDLVAREGMNWLAAYVLSATSTADALEAIRAMPPSGIPDPLTRDAETDTEMGRVYLLANNPHAALPFLRRATRACTAVNFPIAVTQAQLLLGDCLARLDDKRGACDAFQVVNERWGREPRSRSARDTHSRAVALGCPDVSARRDP
jgi:serine/threonine protein kinase/tetratricopeptide (TPR) repeat protein